MNLKQS